MYVCVYVCTHVCMCDVCMYVCMYVCTYVCMYVCVCMYMYVCMYVHTYVCMYMYVCVYVCVCVCKFRLMYMRGWWRRVVGCHKVTRYVPLIFHSPSITHARILIPHSFGFRFDASLRLHVRIVRRYILSRGIAIALRVIFDMRVAERKCIFHLSRCVLLIPNAFLIVISF